MDGSLNTWLCKVEKRASGDCTCLIACNPVPYVIELSGPGTPPATKRFSASGYSHLPFFDATRS